MNKTIIFTAATLTAAASIAMTAGAASASTNGCMTARFQCGTFVQSSTLGSGIARPGWSVAADAPGAPVVMGINEAGNERTDFEVHQFGGGGLTVEYAPGGHRSGLYVTVSVVPAYRQDGIEVRPGDLVLVRGWSNAWAEKFQQDSAGHISDDYSGLEVGTAGLGLPLPTVKHGAEWQLQGNSN